MDALVIAAAICTAFLFLAILAGLWAEKHGG